MRPASEKRAGARAGPTGLRQANLRQDNQQPVARCPSTPGGTHRRARACLWTLLDEARARDLVAWRELGGFEAQDLLDALETGRSHPLLRKWEKLKAGPAANRPTPAPSEQSARRFIVLLRIALKRAGVRSGAARKHIESALRRYSRQIGLPMATDEAIRHWERELRPPLGPEDEAAIKHALDQCGNDAARLTRHFLGLVEFARKPLPADARWR
jgi:hypothetical protein